jgi:hypothetical protein
MFRSKIRPIIIPQLEHARMAGQIAYHWGNDTIVPPPIDKHRFVLGVTDHDRGYDPFDTMGIGEVDATVWLATQKRGLLRELADPIADAVVLLHIRRLLNYADAGVAKDVITLAEQRIANTISRTNYKRQVFHRADTISDFCDITSFIFCFEEPKEITKSVYSNGELIDIQVNLLDGGNITLDPYPLSVPELRGFVLGYEAIGYPDHPQPVMVEYHITSAP